MSSERSRQALVDMLDNVALALSFTVGMTREEFIADRRTFYATTRALEIISEAARRLDPIIEMRHPHLPWHAIRAAGNHYRHEYDNVAEAFVWNTVTNSLPELRSALAKELEEAADAAPPPSTGLVHGMQTSGASMHNEQSVDIEIEIPTRLFEFAVATGINLSDVACKLLEAEIERLNKLRVLSSTVAD